MRYLTQFKFLFCLRPNLYAWSRLERCQSREGANLEYLKNVVLSYLISSDTGCKAHMLNAIAAVLKFSDQEQQRVRQTSWYSRSGSLA